MVGQSDRQDSLLTKEMRRTLSGTTDVDRDNQSRKNFETDMRERISSGLLDFRILNEGLDLNDPDENGTIDYDDLRIILDSRLVNEYGATENYKYDPESPNLPNPNPEFGDTANANIAVTHLVAFAYRGLRAIGNEPFQVLNEAILRGALMGEANHQGVTRDYVALVWDNDNERVDIKIHDKSSVNPLEKWEQDLPMTSQERNELHRQLIDVVPEDVYQEATPNDFDELVEQYLVVEN